MQEFEVCNINRFGDILPDPHFKNWSRDHYHAQSGDSLSY